LKPPKKPNNMFTIKGVLKVEGRLAAILINFMRVFQAAKRAAYQAIRRGVKREEIISSLQEKFIRNARWCQWATGCVKLQAARFPV